MSQIIECPKCQKYIPIRGVDIDMSEFCPKCENSFQYEDYENMFLREMILGGLMVDYKSSAEGLELDSKIIQAMSQPPRIKKTSLFDLQLEREDLLTKIIEGWGLDKSGNRVSGLSKTRPRIEHIVPLMCAETKRGIKDLCRWPNLKQEYFTTTVAEKPNPQENKFCDVCGVLLQGKGKISYCVKHKGIGMTGENNPNWKGPNKRMDDPLYQYNHVLQMTLSHTLAGRRAGHNILALVGLSLEELKKHFQAQFEPWMSWENYGKGWQAGKKHSEFKTKKGVEKSFHYKNLHPTYRKEKT